MRKKKGKNNKVSSHDENTVDPVADLNNESCSSIHDCNDTNGKPYQYNNDKNGKKEYKRTKKALKTQDSGNKNQSADSAGHENVDIVLDADVDTNTLLQQVDTLLEQNTDVFSTNDINSNTVVNINNKYSATNNVIEKNDQYNTKHHNDVSDMPTAYYTDYDNISDESDINKPNSMPIFNHDAIEKNINSDIETQNAMSSLITPTIQEKEQREKKKEHKQQIRKKICKTILKILACLFLISIIIIVLLVYYNDVKIVLFNNEVKLMSHVHSEDFVDMYKNLKVIIKEGKENKEYTYEDLGIQIQWLNIQEEEFDKFVVNMDILNVYFNYSNELKSIINNLNNDRKEWQSAAFVETDDAFIVADEVIGNKVDIAGIDKYVKANFGPRDLVIDLDEWKDPKPDNWITADNYKKELVKWSTFFIEYTNGFTVSKEEIKPFFCLTEDYKIEFNQEKQEELSTLIWSWINNDLNSYNTLGGTFNFTTHNGDVVQLKGVNYGDKINKQKEYDAVYEIVYNLWPCPGRIPEMEIDYPDDIQSNVIEISIDEQHLWRYEIGELESDTDIVTGKRGIYDTPHGVYRILNMIDGVYLEGADYKTWVDKWMRFWNGYGLHDATWRNKFGGSLYISNGSHGCVNLPHSYAVTLYNKVKPGDCVVIY